MYVVIKWKHFLRHWPFVRGPVNSPHKASNNIQLHINRNLLCWREPIKAKAAVMGLPWAAILNHWNDQVLVGNETDDGDVMHYEWWRQWKLIRMMAASGCLIAIAKYNMRSATTGNNGLNLKYWKADRINCHIQNILFLGTELRIWIYNIAW